MDLARAPLKLVQLVSPVPGLSIACSLACELIDVVRLRCDNKSRLCILTQNITEQLLLVASCMKDNIDIASPALKAHVDEFEGLLHNLLRIARSHQKEGLGLKKFLSSWNVVSRKSEICQLEDRLKKMERSFLITVCIGNSLDLTNLQASVSQILQINHKLYNEALRGAEGHLVCHCQARQDQFWLQTPSTTIFVRRWLSTYNSEIFPGVRIVINEARYISDDVERLCLVKHYEGGQLDQRFNEFKRDLAASRRHLNSATLQIFKASKPSAPVLMQVFHAPGDTHIHFPKWLDITMQGNPIKAIYIIFSMRRSLSELIIFQRDNNLECSDNLADASLVHYKYSHRGTVEWGLTYTGRIETQKKQDPEGHDKVMCMKRGICCKKVPLRTPFADIFRKRALIDEYIKKRQFNYTLLAEFFYTASLWGSSSLDLEEITGYKYWDITVPMLVETLISQGWLGGCYAYVRTNEDFALGSMGYMTVRNDCTLEFTSFGDSHESFTQLPGIYVKSEATHNFNTADEKTIMDTCNRYTFHRYPESSTAVSTLQYQNMCETTIWNFFKKEIYNKLSEAPLHVGAHDMQLITRFAISWKFIVVEYELEQCHIVPTVYVFERQRAQNPQGRVRPVDFHASFNPDPLWINDDEWPCLVERKNGYEIYNILLRDKVLIEYLQLPR